MWPVSQPAESLTGTEISGTKQQLITQLRPTQVKSMLILALKLSWICASHIIWFATGARSWPA